MRCLLLCPIAFLCGCNADKIAQLEKENQELQANLSTIELQEKCSKQALLEFKDGGYNGPEYKTLKKMASFTNHYSASLNKCFMEVDYSDFSKVAVDGGYAGADRNIYDAYERKEYASLTLMANGDVVDCHVVKPSGEKQRCASAYEFDDLIKQFMEK